MAQGSSGRVGIHVGLSVLEYRTVEVGAEDDSLAGRKSETTFGLEELNLSQNGLQVRSDIEEIIRHPRRKATCCLRRMSATD
jgi:hypothetical protein